MTKTKNTPTAEIDNLGSVDDYVREALAERGGVDLDFDNEFAAALEAGLNQRGVKDEPASKFDFDKSRVDLIPPEFIEALGLHYGIGAKKYAERNWEKGMSWSRCYAGAQRHMLAFWRGEDIDAETGSPHLIAAAWNMSALHWYALHNVGNDDRVKMAATAASGA